MKAWEKMPIRRLLSCNNNSRSTGYTEGGSKFGNQEQVQDDSYETYESVQVQDVDQYLEAIFGKDRKSSHHGSAINFLDPISPRFVNN
jgi:hypothetical protein